MLALFSLISEWNMSPINTDWRPVPGVGAWFAGAQAGEGSLYNPAIATGFSCDLR